MSTTSSYGKPEWAVNPEHPRDGVKYVDGPYVDRSPHTPKDLVYAEYHDTYYVNEHESKQCITTRFTLNGLLTKATMTAAP